MAFTKTGFTKNSPKNFVLGTGVLMRDFDYKTGAGTSFGATSGVTVSMTTSYTQLEIDGIISTPAGGDIIESTEGTMEVNLLEATAENLASALNATVSKDGGVDYVRPKGKVEMSDYVENLAYIAPHGSGFMAVVFDYALSTEGIEFEPEDGGTNTYSVTFSARSNSDKLDDASLPVTVYFLDSDFYKTDEEATDEEATDEELPEV